jgi:peptidoglycan/xylan/chitin deacetylase (PgdA/CDA1 family)
VSLKKPRHYALEISRLKTRQERVDALEKVPEKYQPIVKTHVTNMFLLKKYKKTHKYK